MSNPNFPSSTDPTKPTITSTTNILPSSRTVDPSTLAKGYSTGTTTTMNPSSMSSTMNPSSMSTGSSSMGIGTGTSALDASMGSSNFSTGTSSLNPSMTSGLSTGTSTMSPPITSGLSTGTSSLNPSMGMGSSSMGSSLSTGTSSLNPPMTSGLSTGTSSLNPSLGMGSSSMGSSLSTGTSTMNPSMSSTLNPSMGSTSLLSPPMSSTLNPSSAPMNPPVIGTTTTTDLLNTVPSQSTHPIVTANNQDILTLFLGEHQRINTLFGNFWSTKLPEEQQQVVYEIIRQISINDGLEDSLLYPLYLNTFPNATNVIDQHRFLNQRVREMNSVINGMKITDKGFTERFNTLQKDWSEQVKYEETTLFPDLQKTVPRQTLVDYGSRMIETRNKMPTRPHTNAPTSTGLGHKIWQTVTAPIDKLRDKSRFDTTGGAH